MFRNKKIVALLLCLVILAQASSAMAVSFSDVTKSGSSGWAYDYIMDLAQKGVINGYDDGTYKPENFVSFLETISLLDGVMAPSATEKTEALAKHKAYLANFSDITWGHDRVAVALERGVITKTDLEQARDAGMLKNGTKVYNSRYTVAMMTARALQLKEKSVSILAYKDLKDIAEAGRGYISALIDAGILHKDGRDGSFLPKESIKRSEMAKIIKIAYDYAASHKQTELEKKTENGTLVEAYEVGKVSYIVYTPKNSSTNTSAKLDSDTKIVDKNNRTVAAKDLTNYKGAELTVVYTGSHPDKLAKEIKMTTDGTIADGDYTFVSFRTSNNKNYITLKDSKGNTLPEFVTVYDYAKDGNTQVRFYSMASGTTLSVKFVAGVVSEASIKTGKTGEYRVESISSDKIGLLKANSYGISTIEYYYVDSSTSYVRNDGIKLASYDLKVGQTIDITKRYNSVSSILDKIVIYSNNGYYNARYTVDGVYGNKLYVTDNQNNREYSYEVANSFYYNGKTYYSLKDISLYKNDKVDLKIDRYDRITEINTANYSNSNNRVKVSLKKNSWSDSLIVSSSYNNDQYIQSNSKVRLYLNNRDASLREILDVVGSTYSYDAEATYYQGNVDSIYVNTSYFGNRVYGKIDRIIYSSYNNTVDIIISFDNGRPRTYTTTKDRLINSNLRENVTVIVELDSNGNIISIR